MTWTRNAIVTGLLGAMLAAGWSSAASAITIARFIVKTEGANDEALAETIRHHSLGNCLSFAAAKLTAHEIAVRIDCDSEVYALSAIAEIVKEVEGIKALVAIGLVREP